MPPRTITDARAYLLNVNTGVNRRLLYPASGDDVGCSVGLFWNVCDSFYLVDPYLNYDLALDHLSKGSHYMSGMRVVATDAPEEGLWDRAVPGRRYQVSWTTSPHIRKRLCFANCGTTIWLASTNTRYNVAICKDYAGITGNADNDFPYETVWGLLNRYGIFAETIGAARSNVRFGFAKYQYLGFDPMFEVVTDDDKRIGFGDGFWLFQKMVDGDAGYHRGKGVELGEILQALTAKLDIFAEELDFTREAIKGKQAYAGLLNLMESIPNKTWGHLSASAEFADWLITQIPQKYAHIHRNLVFDLLAARRLETWGPF
jgi:hypothetical protein